MTEFGMSEKLGPLTLGTKHGPVFLGRDLVESRNYSDATAYEIDKEVRRIVDEWYRRARTVLTSIGTCFTPSLKRSWTVRH